MWNKIRKIRDAAPQIIKENDVKDQQLDFWYQFDDETDLHFEREDAYGESDRKVWHVYAYPMKVDDEGFGNISVHIFRPHGVDGVGVNLYPAHHEFLDELDSAIATHREAGEAIAEYDEENNVE